MADPIAPTTAGRPDDVPDLLVEAIADGDLEAALSLYDRAAIAVLWDGRTASGHRELSVLLNDVLALKLPVRRSPVRTLSSAGTALVCGRWSMHGIDPHGEWVQLRGEHVSVLTLGEGGTWLIRIDHWPASAIAIPSDGRSRTRGAGQEGGADGVRAGLVYAESRRRSLPTDQARTPGTAHRQPT